MCIINKNKLLASIPVLLVVAIISLADAKTNHSRQQIIIASNPAKIKGQEDAVGTSKRRSLINFSALPEGNRTAHHVIGSPFATRKAPQFRQIELGSEDDGQSEVEPATPVLIAESESNEADAVAEIPAEDAVVDETSLCACAPQTYNFRLNFDGDCNTELNNGGVEDSFCFYTQGGNPGRVNDNINFPGARAVGAVGPDGGAFRLFPPKLSGKGRRRRGLRSNIIDHHVDASKLQRLLEKVSFSTHHNHASRIQQKRQAQEAENLDTAPTIITSVTFLEFDSNIEDIINQNSDYFETALADGNIISYPSISAQLDESKTMEEQSDLLLPGGVMLVLFGANAENAVIQNTVAWGYDLTECNTEPLEAGDAIGWVSLEGKTPPRNAFCPGVTDPPADGPSASPTGIGPTVAPVKTAGPVMAVDTSSAPSSAEIIVPKTMAPTAKTTTKLPTPTPDAPEPAPEAKAAKSSKAAIGAKSAKNGGKGDATVSEETGEPPMAPGDEKYPKSSKAFGTKANKVFTQDAKATKDAKSAKAMPAEKGADLVGADVPVAKDDATMQEAKAGKISTGKEKDAKAIKLSPPPPRPVSAKSSKTKPGTKATKAAKSESKTAKVLSSTGSIQLSRPQLPKSPAPSVPIPSPTTPAMPISPPVPTTTSSGIATTPNPTEKSSMLDPAVVASPTASVGTITYPPSTGATATAGTIVENTVPPTLRAASPPRPDDA